MTTGQQHTIVNVENIHGEKLGHGPLTSVIDWKVKREMDRSSEWQVRIAATDPQIDIVKGQRYIAINALVGGRWQYVGGGQINKITRRIPKGGTIPIVTVSGMDTLFDLGWTKVTFDESGNLRHILESILPDGWDVAGDVDSPPFNELYVTAEYDNRLNLLNRAVHMAQTHFRLQGRRTVYITDDFEDSGLVAVDAQDAISPHNAAIASLSVEEDSNCLFGSIRPLGSGNSGSSLTLLGSNKDVRPGMTIDRAKNVIYSTRFQNEFEQDIGQRERVVQFNEVTQASGNEIDLIAAANQLQASAEYSLSLSDHVHEEYKIKLTDSNTLIRPLETVRVTYTDSVQDISLDRDLYVLSVEWMGGRNGIQTSSIRVANMRRYGQTGQEFLDVIRERSNESRAYKVQRQRGPAIVNKAFSSPIDDNVTVKLPFWLSESVLQIQSATMRTNIQEVVSTIRAVLNSRETSTESPRRLETSDGGSGSVETGNGKLSDDSAFAETDDVPETTLTITGGDDLPSATGDSAEFNTRDAQLGSQTAENTNTDVTIQNSGTNQTSTTTTTHLADGVTSVRAGQTATTASIASVPTRGPSRTWSRSTYTNRGSLLGYRFSSGGDIGAPDLNNISAVAESGIMRVFGGPSTGNTGSFSVPAVSDYNAHTHAFTLPSRTITIPSHSHIIRTPTHSHGLPSGVHSHTATVAAHGHNVPAAAAHNHGVPPHRHSLNIVLNESLVQEAHRHGLPPHIHDVDPSTHTHGFTIPAHDHTVRTQVQLQYGIYRQDEELFEHKDLEWRINGSVWHPFTREFGARPIEDDWIEVDVTEVLQDPVTFRPQRQANRIEIRRRDDSQPKLGQISVDLEMEVVIQSRALVQ